ncbi:LCP family protein [Clostridium vincentii]|uniref:Transcriptional regulator LytR n=1 Tax=Clostridium vincentii TaxID=52704 RepID=A0A2T0BGN2_9CLOT|nr:LCP family protein [Clostridium vincentii]PRR83066.1 Transcriptional regulator LytR [Clostridium vincentii]
MRDKERKRKKTKNPWSAKKKIIVILSSLLGVILLGLLGAAGYSYYVYSRMDNVQIDREEVLNDTGKKEEYSNIINIALFGVDRGEDDGGEGGLHGLSDAIMILTINEDTKQLKISSIMRDTYVNIPTHGDDIINTAMLAGGPELMLKTINTNFDLDIDKFIGVNLESLPKIIDKLGGLDINVDSEEVPLVNGLVRSINERTSNNSSGITSAGMQHLNGTQATAYARIRHTDGNDFKRTQRQRTVITLIANKLSAMSVDDLNSFVLEGLPIVQTNLTYAEVVSIGTKVLSIGTGNILQNRFPNDGDHWSSTVNGGYRLNIDKEATTEKMHKFIYE